MTRAIPAPYYRNLSHQYGCAASMTEVTFEKYGILHRARRFWREDMPTSGKVEIYTLTPWPGAMFCMTSEQAWYDSAFSEDFLRYADVFNPGTVDSMALAALADVQAWRSSAGDTVESSQVSRFAGIELN